MEKHDQESAVAEGGRRATGGGRFSVGRKSAVVMCLLRGEDLESVSREWRITAARASQWRDQFLAAGQAGLKSRATDVRGLCGGGSVRGAGGESRIPTFTNKLAAQTLAFLSHLKHATFTVFSEYPARISACVSAASGGLNLNIP